MELGESDRERKEGRNAASMEVVQIKIKQQINERVWTKISYDLIPGMKLSQYLPPQFHQKFTEILTEYQN